MYHHQHIDTDMSTFGECFSYQNNVLSLSNTENFIVQHDLNVNILNVHLKCRTCRCEWEIYFFINIINSCHDRSELRLTPILPPHELKIFLLGKVLFHLIMSPLNQHCMETHTSQKIGHGGRVSKWINGPPRHWLYSWPKVFFNPLMPFNHLIQHGIVMCVSLVRHHPSTCYNL